MQPATGSAIGKRMSRNGDHKENRVSGLTHGDDFVLTGPTKRLTEFENEMTSVFPIKAKIIRSRIAKEHQDVEQKVALGKGRNRVPT